MVGALNTPRQRQYLIKPKNKGGKHLNCLTSAVRRVHEALVDGSECVLLTDKKTRTTICFDKEFHCIWVRGD